jgi:hypothetical protein
MVSPDPACSPIWPQLCAHAIMQGSLLQSPASFSACSAAGGDAPLRPRAAYCHASQWAADSARCLRAEDVPELVENFEATADK